MSWILHTSADPYVISAAPDGLGLLGQWGTQMMWEESLAHAATGRLEFECTADVAPLIFVAHGTRHSQRSDLIVSRADGSLGARLRLGQVSLEREGPRTHVAADHVGEGILARLHLESDTRHRVLRQWLEITNQAADQLLVEKAHPGAVEAPGHDVEILAGAWGSENTVHRARLPAGTLEIGSRQGITSHAFSPVLGVPGPAGEWVSVALAWSGSWVMRAEVMSRRGTIRISGGFDDETGRIRLDPGTRLTTPPLYWLAAPDQQSATQAWHQFARLELRRPDPAGHHPVIYNSWYATAFDVAADQQIELAASAAQLGVEVFVIDDGWFRGRRDDTAALGDWTPDTAAFPHGLADLIQRVADAGMRFGLWIEPECVSPDSDLYRAHPDWVYRAGDRPLTTIRHQLVLDLGRPEVEQWCADMLRGLLSDYDISYLKWDMNRPISDGGRPGDPHGRAWSQQHTEAYYRLLEVIRDEFGHVTVETCSGGGARLDPGVLARCDAVWASDETGPRDRLGIQDGFLRAYHPSWLASWVTDVPDRADADPASFEFRFVVAMAGIMGIGGNLAQWSPGQRERAAELVALYREHIRPMVLEATLRRHGTPGDGQYCLQYTTQDRQRVAILAFARPGGHRPDIDLGLDGSYAVHGSQTVIEASAPFTVAYRLAQDCDVVVLDRL
ncbi:MAG: alpha-galactosidase [Arachnia sp.]